MNKAPAKFSYGRLRSWYLARLRRKIIKKMSTDVLTPGKLIAADSAAVQDLVLGASYATVREPRSSTKDKNHLIASCLPLLFSLPLYLFAIQMEQKIAIPFVSTIAILSIVCSIVIHTFLSRSKSTPNVQDVVALRTELAEAIQREHAIADYALDVIAAFDQDGVFLSASPAACDLFGNSLANIVGQPLGQFVITSDLEKLEKTFRAIRETGNAVFDTSFKRPDGSLVDVLWKAEWSQSDGAIYAIARDVTAQKRAERMRREFVSMLGHDLRTPLTSLTCSLEIIQGGEAGELSEYGAKLIDTSLRSIERLLRLVNQLLDLQKMEEGMVSLSKTDTDLNGLLNSCVSSISSFAGKRGIVLQVQSEPVSLQIDRDRMSQVIVNLLSNAIKFSPDGGTISITLAKAKDAPEVIVSVEDQGIGIAPEAHELIFERYRQVETQQAKQGTGLGLHICKAIVEAHGGRINVASKPGSGSRFWFTLPLQ